MGATLVGAVDEGDEPQHETGYHGRCSDTEGGEHAGQRD
jgi:hypothetical protein